MTNILIIVGVVVAVLLLALVIIIIYRQCNKVQINVIGEYDEVLSGNSLEMQNTGRALIGGDGV